MTHSPNTIERWKFKLPKKEKTAGQPDVNALTVAANVRATVPEVPESPPVIPVLEEGGTTVIFHPHKKLDLPVGEARGEGIEGPPLLDPNTHVPNGQPHNF